MEVKDYSHESLFYIIAFRLFSTHRESQLAASAFKYYDWIKVIATSLQVGFYDEWKRGFS
jgi:hypothetical protein